MCAPSTCTLQMYSRCAGWTWSTPWTYLCIWLHIQHTATRSNSLQRTATYCNTLQHTAGRVPRAHASGAHVECATVDCCMYLCIHMYIFETMLHNATQCNTLQHTAGRMPRALESGAHVECATVDCRVPCRPSARCCALETYMHV